MIRILILITLLPLTAISETSMGLLQGRHILNEDLNNTHPYVTYEKENFGLTAFINSFQKLSIAPHYRVNTRVSDVELIARIGAVTGYDELTIYNNKVYKIHGALFLSRDLMLIVAPEFRYNFSGKSYMNAVLLGDSITFGLGVRF